MSDGRRGWEKETGSGEWGRGVVPGALFSCLVFRVTDGTDWRLRGGLGGGREGETDGRGEGDGAREDRACEEGAGGAKGTRLGHQMCCWLGRSGGRFLRRGARRRRGGGTRRESGGQMGGSEDGDEGHFEPCVWSGLEVIRVEVSVVRTRSGQLRRERRGGRGSSRSR